MPFTLKEPSRLVTVLPVLNAERRTPGLSRASDEYSRPFSGSSTACRPVMSWPRWLESVSSTCTAPTTCTVSLTWPGARARSTRCRAPTFTETLSATAVEKPCNSAVTLYRPIRTVMNSKLPFASVTRTMATPVSRFVRVTVAPGTTPPVLSLTVPTTVAVSNCANDGRAAARRHTADMTVTRTHRLLNTLGTLRWRGARRLENSVDADRTGRLDPLPGGSQAPNQGRTRVGSA